MAVEIALADVSELRGKGIDVLADQVIAAKSASNDPEDIKAAEEAKAPKAEEKKPEKKPDEGVTQRIGELTRKQREAERTALVEREGRLKAEARIAELEAAKPKAELPPKPKREDFDDTEAFTDALVDWKLAAKEAEKAEQDGKTAAEAKTKAAKEEADRQTQQDAEKTAAEIAQRFAEQQDAARKAHEDFEEVITASANVMLKPSLAQAMVTSAVGGELQYHLAKHPEVIDRLNGMDNTAMLKELGRIEQSLEPKKPAADGDVDQPRGADGKFVSTKDVSAAAEPIAPVKEGAATATGSKNPDDMSVEEHRQAAFRSSRGR